MQTSPKGLHLEPETYFRGSDEGFQSVYPTNVEHLPMEVFSQSLQIVNHFGDEAVVNRSRNPQLCWDGRRFDALLWSNQASPPLPPAPPLPVLPLQAWHYGELPGRLQPGQPALAKPPNLGCNFLLPPHDENWIMKPRSLELQFQQTSAE